MEITSCFFGKRIGDANYLFFWLTEDYIEQQKKITEELDPLLRLFARNIGQKGILIRPFYEDINATQKEVKKKFNTHEACLKINKTPGLLIINKDFDAFEFDNDPWVFFSFRDLMDSSASLSIFKAQELLSKLGQACIDGIDLFKELDRIISERLIDDLFDTIEIKPSIFGLSIDISKGLKILERIF